MTDQNVIDSFNTNIDKLLENGQIEPEIASDEYSDMLKLAQELAAKDTRNKSHVEKLLRAELITLINNKKSLPSKALHDKPLQLQRSLLVLSVLAVILILAMITIPSARVLAQDIIHRIGSYIVTNKPSEAESYVATQQSDIPTRTIDPKLFCTDCFELGVVGSLTKAQASIKASFPVYEPVYVPNGYFISSRDVFTSTATTTVDTSYRKELDPPLHDGLQMAGIIAIDQTQNRNNSQSWEKGIGDVPIVNVTVQGQAGIWLEDVPMTPVQDQQGQWDYKRWNQLMWARDGYDFIIQTNMPSDLLPLNELLKIAESLAP